MIVVSFAGMHRKSMEVAQHYSEAENKLKDNAVTSSGGGGNSGGNNSDSYSVAAAAAQHHQQQRAQQQLQQQLHNLSNAQQNSLFDAATAAALGGIGENSEDFRSNSIASLRAKAQQHSAKLIQSAHQSTSSSDHHPLDDHHHLGHHQNHHHHKIDAGTNPLQVSL